MLCAIAVKGKIVPNVKNPLLLKSATRLAEEIREGKDVVQAYTDRILQVEPFINATVDRCFLDAMEEARKVDVLIASGKYTKEKLAETWPLLGVPFSVKVLLLVKGLRCTGGSVLFEDLRASEDSPSVALMKQAGAIVIATTNSAEMGMNFETNNILHGKTSNPYDIYRTSGGSSGGESALLAAAGSVIGLGNDLLGSIRVPCHFTGLFGHKPTMGLVPNLGVHPTPDPEMAHFLYTGPMCRYAEDLIVTMRVLSSQSGLSLNFVPNEIRGPLVAPVNRDIALALQSAVSYFKTNYGIQTEEIKLPSLYDSNRAVFSEMLCRVKDLKASMTAGKGMHINEKLDYFKYIFGRSTLSKGPLLVLNACKLSVMYNKDKVPFYKEIVDSWEKEFNKILDENTVLMMPTLPVPAPYHSEILYYFPVLAIHRFSMFLDCHLLSVLLDTIRGIALWHPNCW
ncbi:fatty-acid amide hydrolase 2-A [Caerostris extrusa]|uniref:Fatty-acid amide hydrolase 2-A n=1 Tax=Caerostris extrusa TaxID=172846 RepID=A0AAV4NAH7_CAEEX|nr:fatty-acid amide hydrolase 2-A [Caerostris extrusa]